MLRTRVRFSGRVQGVGFRMTTHRLAANHRVSGWVRNDDDGRVTLELQGEPNEVQALLDAIGDAMSDNIERTDRLDIDPEPDEHGFRITG